MCVSSKVVEMDVSSKAEGLLLGEEEGAGDDLR